MFGIQSVDVFWAFQNQWTGNINPKKKGFNWAWIVQNSAASHQCEFVNANLKHLKKWIVFKCSKKANRAFFSKEELSAVKYNIVVKSQSIAE